MGRRSCSGSRFSQPNKCRLRGASIVDRPKDDEDERVGARRVSWLAFL